MHVEPSKHFYKFRYQRWMKAIQSGGRFKLHALLVGAVMLYSHGNMRQTDGPPGALYMFCPFPRESHQGSMRIGMFTHYLPHAWYGYGVGFPENKLLYQIIFNYVWPWGLRPWKNPNDSVGNGNDSHH
eukprot:TRINITY_DN707_c1_g1_i1.p2 TRINITY_DN707_c1_g1~~TRINITY_DN707_c1_g1_i1.p2  ORF type:complete len:136 (+),score=18.25 TRINITY_DN707_c1_g1_i1:26-409(+)